MDKRDLEEKTEIKLLFAKLFQTLADDPLLFAYALIQYNALQKTLVIPKKRK